MKDFNDKARPPPNHQKKLASLITLLAPGHSAWQVFSDFVEMSAISISNAVDFHVRERRERRYMEIVSRYKPDEVAVFPKMLAELTLGLEDEPSDVLGQTFHDLELHNKYAGQYFTPYDVCRMMSRMTLEGVEEKISANGFVTALEPAVGGGAMVIALAHEMREMKINYQEHLHVTAVDVDAKCVHMAYLQLSLLHVPAIIIHGDSLSLEEFDHWRTPAHIMGGWRRRLSTRSIANESHAIERPPEITPARQEERVASPSQLTLF